MHFWVMSIKSNSIFHSIKPQVQVGILSSFEFSFLPSVLNSKFKKFRARYWSSNVDHFILFGRFLFPAILKVSWMEIEFKISIWFLLTQVTSSLAVLH